MQRIFCGVALVKGSAPPQFTIVAIYRSFTGTETVSHLVEKPLSDAAMRRHLTRSGMSPRDVEAAMKQAAIQEV